MAFSVKVHCLVFAVLIVSYAKNLACGEPEVPCYFIFGDSLVDNGNNNHLATDAKVNYPPYGIDFPSGPTGRFTNGRTTADILGELLGFEDFIPPFANAPNGAQLLKGLNYASGSAGILQETGKKMGENVDLSTQLQHHKTTISRMVKLLGNTDLALKHLSKCLYFFAIGSNDYVNNYFMPQYYSSSHHYSPDQFSQMLIDEYSQKLKILYSYGARKVALAGMLPIGCTPNATSYYGTDGSICVDKINFASNLFNGRLELLADQLSHDLPDANFVYLGLYGSFPGSHIPGINIKLTECCEVDEHGMCIPNLTACQYRNFQLFWDSFHPTEILNQVTGKIAYEALKRIL